MNITEAKAKLRRLATLKGLAANDLERQAMQRRIDTLAASIARVEYTAKAGPVRREMMGAY